MRAKTFRGGVHVPENKGRTSEKSIEVMPLPRRVVIPSSSTRERPANRS